MYIHRRDWSKHSLNNSSSYRCNKLYNNSSSSCSNNKILRKTITRSPNLSLFSLFSHSVSYLYSESAKALDFHHYVRCFILMLHDTPATEYELWNYGKIYMCRFFPIETILYVWGEWHNQITRPRGYFKMWVLYVEVYRNMNWISQCL